MKLFLSVILLLSGSLVCAQEQILRWEVEKKITENDFSVLPAGEAGVVVLRERDKFEDGDRKWEFKFLNTELEEIIEFEMFLDDDFSLVGYDFQFNNFYLLYRDGMMNDSDLYLYKVDFTTADYIQFKIMIELELELSHFLVSGDNMVLGGRVDNKPAVVHYSMITKKAQVLPGFFRSETELVDMKKNINGTINVLFLDKETNRDNNVLSLKVYSDTGEMLLESTTTFEEDLRVHSGITNELEGSDLIIVGTYGNKKSKLSRGFYFINVNPGTNDEIAFTDFTELDNFFKFEGENREERIKEKIQNSRQGKPYEYRTNMMVWKINEEEGRYQVFGELVDPQYQTNTRRRFYPYSYAGTPYYDDYYFNNSTRRTSRSSSSSLTNRDVMVSVKYRQNVMVSFDKNGNRLYDVSHVIDDVETDLLDQLSAYNYRNGQFQMLYKKRDELFFAKGSDNGNIEADSLVNIKSLNSMDDIKNDDMEEGAVVHWYDNYYYVWGKQRIQNLENNERRTVFYINKIKM